MFSGIAIVQRTGPFYVMKMQKQAGIFAWKTTKIKATYKISAQRGRGGKGMDEP